MFLIAVSFVEWDANYIYEIFLSSWTSKKIYLINELIVRINTDHYPYLNASEVGDYVLKYHREFFSKNYYQVFH